MNIVLYTEDLEPITILDLPLWLLEQMEKQGAVRVAVLRPLQFSEGQVGKVPVGTVDMPDTVTIYCEKLRWRDGKLKSILVTKDEELALMLRPDWLPGQRGAIQGYQRAIRSLTTSLVKAMRKN